MEIISNGLEQLVLCVCVWFNNYFSIFLLQLKLHLSNRFSYPSVLFGIAAQKEKIKVNLRIMHLL